MPRAPHRRSVDPLVAAKRAFASWRADGRPGRQIPATLWAAAAAAARAHGISRTAVALRLNHARLRREVDRVLRARRLVGERAAPCTPPPFVELPPLPVTAPPGCRIEIHDRTGRRVCVDLAASALAQLPAVLRACWPARR